ATGEKRVEEQTIYPEWEPYTGMKPLVVDAEVKKLYAIAEINRALKVMSEAYEAGDETKAKEVLEYTSERMKTLYPEAGNETVKELMLKMDTYLTAFRNLARKKAIQGSKEKKIH